VYFGLGARVDTCEEEKMCTNSSLYPSVQSMANHYMIYAVSALVFSHDKLYPAKFIILKLTLPCGEYSMEQNKGILEDPD
jgi:hypothetical protein